MDESQGGRLILRKVDSTGENVEYAGEIVTREGVWPVRFRISEVGAVESFVGAPGAPAWLVDFSVAVLRATFRASRESGRWPRRLERWRQAQEPNGAGR